MEQNGTKERYTGKRKKVAEMLANPDFTGTMTELIELVDVPRTTFYRWLEDEQFINYINSLVEKHTDSELAAVWKALVRECKKGNVQAIKLFFELKGKYVTKIEGRVLAKFTDPFDGLTTEELRKLAKWD